MKVRGIVKNEKYVSSVALKGGLKLICMHDDCIHAETNRNFELHFSFATRCFLTWQVNKELYPCVEFKKYQTREKLAQIRLEAPFKPL